MNTFQAKIDEYVKKYRLNVDYIREINDDQLIIDLIQLAERASAETDSKITPSDVIKLYYISMKTDNDYFSEYKAIKDMIVENLSVVKLDVQISMLGFDNDIIVNKYKYEHSISEENFELFNNMYQIYCNDFKCHIVDWIKDDNNNSFILYDRNRYKRNDFIEYIYGKKKVDVFPVFNDDIKDDLFRITIPQRTKLIYHALSSKYKNSLIKIDKIDEEELFRFCTAHRDIPAAKGLLSLFKMGISLSQLATFGIGHEASGAAKNTWCYKAQFLEDKAVYIGQPITWEDWKKKLIYVLDNRKDDNTIIDGFKLEFVSLEDVFNTSLYYQNGNRLTLTKEDKNKIDIWKYQYMKDRKAAFPFSGKINREDEEYSFTVNYFDDIDEKVITPTDKNIIKLFSEFGTGYKDIKRRNENLFFTNLCLGYRNKDYSKNFKDKWLQNDLKYLIGFDEITERDTKHISGMLEIIMPDVVICLGKKVYEIIINELSCTKVNLNNFYELLDNHKNFKNILYNGKTITFFAVSHPGGMGSANRKAHCTIKTDKSGFELMADDWHKIGMFIRNKI